MESTGLYLAPAHIDRRISGNYVCARHQDDADDCYALLVSGFDHFDEGFVDVFPMATWLKVIDAETFEAHADTIFTQAENRLHTQKAVLNWCVKG